MIKAIISDIDGTLTQPLDRGNPKTRGYFDWDRVGEDKPNSLIIDIVQHLQSEGAKLIIVTGRKEKARSDTETWLKDKGIEQDLLYMRPNDNNTPASEYKLDVFNSHIVTEYDVIVSMDDDPKTSQMWASLGIPTLRVMPNA